MVQVNGKVVIDKLNTEERYLGEEDVTNIANQINLL